MDHIRRVHEMELMLEISSFVLEIRIEHVDLTKLKTTRRLVLVVKAMTQVEETCSLGMQI